MKAAETFSLLAGAGYSLPLQWFAAESSSASVVVMAARFYQSRESVFESTG